jgi:hypothetical protein
MNENLDLFNILLAKSLASGEGGEGFTPTDEQLAAMNSGITAEGVEQISINKTNISSLQQQVGYANTELEGVL